MYVGVGDAAETSSALLTAFQNAILLLYHNSDLNNVQIAILSLSSVTYLFFYLPYQQKCNISLPCFEHVCYYVSLLLKNNEQSGSSMPSG